MEYLLGRTTSTARAALALSRSGYYDESLALSRNLGEIANLLAWFVADAAALDEWKSASKKQRISKYGPAAIRKRLQTLGQPPLITAERYGILCEIATHVTPETRPQSHNTLLIPMVGNFQRIGYVLALNELSLPVALTGMFGVQLVSVPKPVQLRTLSACRNLVSGIGGINVLDGFPRLNDEAIAEAHRLVLEVPREERPAALEMLRRLGI